MSKPFHLSPVLIFANRIVCWFIRLGLGPADRYVLTVQGRKSGRQYSTPVTLIEEGTQRWLISPYGEVQWVKNARVAGQVTLTKKNRSETLRITEVPPADRSVILKKYLAREPVTRPYFHVDADAPLEAFVAEGQYHPVFLLHPR